MAPKKKWIRAPELTENSTKRPKQPENSGLDQTTHRLRIVSYNSFFSGPLPGGPPPPTTGEEGSALHQLEESALGRSPSSPRRNPRTVWSGAATPPVHKGEAAAHSADNVPDVGSTCRVQSPEASNQPKPDRRDSTRETAIQQHSEAAETSGSGCSDSVSEESTLPAPSTLTPPPKASKDKENKKPPPAIDVGATVSENHITDHRARQLPPTTPVKPGASGHSERRVVSDNNLLLHRQRLILARISGQRSSPAEQFRRAQEHLRNLHRNLHAHRITIASQLRFVHSPTRRLASAKSSISVADLSAQLARGQIRDDMASAVPRMSGDARRYNSSGTARYENKPPMNQSPQLCKNGPHCRKHKEGQ